MEGSFDPTKNNEPRDQNSFDELRGMLKNIKRETPDEKKARENRFKKIASDITGNDAPLTQEEKKRATEFMKNLKEMNRRADQDISPKPNEEETEGKTHR